MIRAAIYEKLGRSFRKSAMKRFGYGRRVLTKAVEEAVLKWISSTEDGALTFEGDPIKTVDGVLSRININSVILQHEMMDLWPSKVLTNASD